MAVSLISRILINRDIFVVIGERQGEYRMADKSLKQKKQVKVSCELRLLYCALGDSLCRDAKETERVFSSLKGKCTSMDSIKMRVHSMFSTSKCSIDA